MASSLPGPAVIVPYRPIRRCIFPSLHFQPRTAKLEKEGTLLLENQITKLRIIGRSSLRQDLPLFESCEILCIEFLFLRVYDPSDSVLTLWRPGSLPRLWGFNQGSTIFCCLILKFQEFAWRKCVMGSILFDDSRIRTRRT
ncbi:unnamed protein product [Musa hybrid cultivar]